ncbi:MAG: divalent metal cation transporter, partial [Maribacter sp.]|nr:divalent metal cation transporter [Maribacter sp.]
FFLSFDIKPIDIIKFAQVANGILLPVIAVFLVWIVNKEAVMGEYRNTRLQNMMGWGIIILAIILGAKSVSKVFGLF